MDRKKIVNICLIILAVLLYLVTSQIADLVFDTLKMQVDRDWFLTIPELIGLVVSSGAFFVVYKNATISGFLSESVNELLKVTYPTPKESGQSAIVVVVMVAAAALVLTIFDSVWSFVTKLILSN